MSFHLAQTAQTMPDAVALISGRRAWSYAGLNAMTARYAQQLAAVGVQPGEHVALLLPNRPETIALIHALARLHAVLVALNTRLTASEIKWQVERARCTTVICSRETEPLVTKLDGLCVVSVDDPTQPGIDNLANWHVEPPEPPQRVRPTPPERVTTLVFTSGTTGQPKAAMLTRGNFDASAAASRQAVDGLGPGDRWLLALPLYHVGGLSIVWRSVLAGSTIVLHDRFDVDAVSHALDHDDITHLSLVPTMLKRLLDARDTSPAPEALRLLLLGGAAALPDLLRRAFDLGWPVAPTYGLTEACSQVATLLPDAARAKPGSAGKPLPGTQVRILSDDGCEQPPNRYGEVVVSGPTVMAGYFDAPDNRALRDGLFYTGDIGYMDDDGDLWLVQRRSDLIVSGGENVYPAEVEAALREHPAIVEACVVGIDDAEWGQRVAAAIVSLPNADISADDVMRHARAHLAGYKIPRIIRFVDDLPQTASGKIQRSKVRDLLQA